MKGIKLKEKCPIDGKIAFLEGKDNTYFFCAYHYFAYHNLKDGYHLWNEKLEKKLSWEEYLDTILKLKDKSDNLVGEWVKDVISFLLKKQ